MLINVELGINVLLVPLSAVFFDVRGRRVEPVQVELVLLVLCKIELEIVFHVRNCSEIFFIQMLS